MFEILALLAFLPALAKHRKRRRRFRPYIRGNVDETIALGTLASRTVVAQVFDETVDEKTFVSSIVATYSISDITPLENAGPIVVGLAHGDYTSTEIEEWIEQTASWTIGNLQARREVGKRWIRQIGIFQTPGTTVTTFVLNDGKPIKTKLGWTLGTGQTIDLWAYNLGSVALATTSPDIHCQGHINLWPQ